MRRRESRWLTVVAVAKLLPLRPTFFVLQRQLIAGLTFGAVKT